MTRAPVPMSEKNGQVRIGRKHSLPTSDGIVRTFGNDTIIGL